jgi:HlyD family secretion protein
MNARTALTCFATLLLGGAVAACGSDRTAVPQATGTVEVTEVDVAPLIPARVVRVLPLEGASVARGDTLATLVQSTTRADVEARRARVAEAQAQLADLEAGSRTAEIARARSELAAAQAEATRAASDRERLAPLAAASNISRQQYDAAVALERSTAARRDAARAALRLLEEGTRPERITAARAEVGAARAALAAAQQTAADLVLTAPVAGTVLSRNAEPGEVIPAGVPALTLGDVARPYVRVYVDESVLPRLAVGQRATAVLDAFPDRRFEGRIVALSPRAEFTPRIALTRDERADLMFGVRVDFADTTGMLKAGLPVTVHFVGARAP